MRSPRASRTLLSARRGLALALGAASLAGVLLSACPSSDDAGRGSDDATTAKGEAAPLPALGWPAYGGDDGGRRYSALDRIHRGNVRRLRVAWTYRHGDGTADEDARREAAYELTPLVVEGVLYGCSPANRVFALDAATGAERWSWDARIPRDGRYANQMICRGVSYWRDDARDTGACARRIFTATNDARLVALDAATGRPCAGFGAAGEVALKPGVGPERWLGEYQVTSPPQVVGDLVVVGSAVADNQRVDAPSGVVRAFDARTGALRWAWDLAPPGMPPPPEGTYTPGTPNVWAPMSADPERDLLFVPTGNPSPDYYRGRDLARRDHYGSSVVALRASTGRVVWRFQTVHHDLWDYDVPAQPTLVTLRGPTGGGGPVPALVQATKTGLLFVLDRRSGEPLFPVEERPVPTAGAPGEEISPTQPFPVRPPPLVPHTLGEAWGLTPFDRAACRRRFEALRYEGIYTPPSLHGSLMYPGNGGGSNWGGVAFDPERQLVLANTMDLAWSVQLLPGDQVPDARIRNPGIEISPQQGTPYGMRREALLSPLGIPCNPPPWGTLAAVDLAAGEIVWQVPVGTVRDIAPLPIPWRLGTPNIGGPLVTAGGLVFLGATMDDYLRAFDVETGEELWSGRLPAGGQATPMTYAAGGRQLVVIAAGGHARAGTRRGDHLVAFALADDD